MTKKPRVSPGFLAWKVHTPSPIQTILSAPEFRRISQMLARGLYRRLGIEGEPSHLTPKE